MRRFATLVDQILLEIHAANYAAEISRKRPMEKIREIYVDRYSIKTLLNLV